MPIPSNHEFQIGQAITFPEIAGDHAYKITAIKGTTITIGGDGDNEIPLNLDIGYVIRNAELKGLPTEDPVKYAYNL